MSVHFTVTSTAKNAVQWVPKCIESVRRQTYQNWYHVYSAADADTHVAAVHCLHSRLAAQYSSASILENVWRVWKELPDDEIIVWLDGDDWLATDHALQIIADAYADEPAPWLTYGSFKFSSHPGVETPYLGTRYPQGANVRRDVWRASHLKTFRAGLVKRIDERDLKRRDGSWIDLCTDRAFMLPMLEMAGERYTALPHVLSVYNWEASYSYANAGEDPAHASARIREEETRAYLHNLRAYRRLNERPW